MRYLADTHALLWWLAGNLQLSPLARAAIENDDSEVCVSAASAWEITTKFRLGKLPEAATLAPDVEGGLGHHGFTPLPITMAHAEQAGRLAGSHKDPFDRMLVAQALSENLTLISNEQVFDAFGVRRLW